MKSNKKKSISFEEKLANAEKVLEGKELKENGRQLFERALKKAANPKPRFAK